MGANGRWKWRVRVCYGLVALVALSGGGCLAVAAGTALVAGGAVATAYVTGNVSREYRGAGFHETLAATKQSLIDFGMQVTKEQMEPNDTATLESLTGSGQSVHITLHTRLAEIPAHGPITTVEVRVGPFGDRSMPERFGAAGQERPLSDQLLDQIGGRLNLTPQVVPVVSPAGPVTDHQSPRWASPALPNAPLPRETPPPPMK
jgi:hypothetical protein